ncbi:MAG: DMT family transporter [bacterium]|nr:DMT family transporter [bacterium]
MLKDIFIGGGWLKPSLFALFFWGWWGFLTKLGAERIHWQTMMICFGAATVIFALFPGTPRIKLELWSLVGVGAGIAGALGFLYFFMALDRGPATVVIPLTSLYVTISSILAFVLLAEPITLKKICGIGCAVLAIILLSG